MFVDQHTCFCLQLSKSASARHLVRAQDFLMESDQIKCEQSKFILFSSVPCTLNSVGFHENILNAIDSRQQKAVCEDHSRDGSMEQ